MNKAFFDAVRASLFRGRLTQAQVEGLTKIVTYGLKHGFSRPDLAYVLATAHWEVGGRMQPVREGFATTNAGAIRAVTAIFNKGIITRNYALPDQFGRSYYGRGYVQITWKDNYAKFENILGIPLVSNPDLALDPDIAVQILFIGMRDGLFRKGRSLDDVPDCMKEPDFTPANRDMINGDVKKNGQSVADLAELYWIALDGIAVDFCAIPAPPTPVAAPAPKPVPAPVVIETPKKETPVVPENQNDLVSAVRWLVWLWGRYVR